ncbi:MAG: response regulator [Pirellulaceae bacterium]
MFAQVESESSRYSGLGIGLSLVKSLVEMHGGVIAASSQGEGLGATFTVRLPVSHEHAGSGNTSIAPEAASASELKRILVVDDNVAAAKLLAIVIRKIGHDVQVANDGRQAVQIGGEFKPDIVIMDIGMPIMDGYEAARAMRREPWGKEIELIALTGWGQDDDRQRTTQAGFNRHLVKPVEPDTIRSILAELSVRSDED